MMRGLLLAVLALAGCQATPASLGITGPGGANSLAAPTDSMTGNPGIPDAPSGYGPSTGYGPANGPQPTGGSFFNYN
jgi:hypothetical protein